MSIIEKALGKKGNQSDTAKEVKPESPATAASAPLIEQAQAKSEVRATILHEPTPVAASSSVALDAQSPRLLKLDLTRLRARGLLTSDDERGHMAEEYRMIKRPLVSECLRFKPRAHGQHDYDHQRVAG